MSNENDDTGVNREQSTVTTTNTEVLEASDGLSKNSVINSVIRGDCIDVLGGLPSGEADLIVADPPYNLSGDDSISLNKDSDGDGRFGGEWSQTNESWDKMDGEEYLTFSERWISESKRVLSPSGSIVIFGSYHNIGLMNTLLSDGGFEMLNEIIWFKRNAMPNLQCNRFTASHENILWATPDNDSGYTFNYEETKSWPCESERVNEKGKQIRSVWDIPNNKSKIEQEYNHPTQKPLRVLERIIRATSSEGDWVIVPFAGSGSTLVSANLNRRRFTGIEVEEEYIKTAREYVNNVLQKPDAIIGECISSRLDGDEA